MSMRIKGYWAMGVVLAIGLALLAGACDTGGGDVLVSDETTPTAEASPAGLRTTRAEPTISPTPARTIPAPDPTVAATPTEQVIQQIEDSGTLETEIIEVEPFVVTVETGVNIRSAPTTDSSILGGIFPGEERTVIGVTSGETVEADLGDRWFALQDGGFVYAAIVTAVE